VFCLCRNEEGRDVVDGNSCLLILLAVGKLVRIFGDNRGWGLHSSVVRCQWCCVGLGCYKEFVFVVVIVSGKGCWGKFLIGNFGWDFSFSGSMLLGELCAGCRVGAKDREWIGAFCRDVTVCWGSSSRTSAEYEFLMAVKVGDVGGVICCFFLCTFLVLTSCHSIS
jgi:hypothetical protein